MSRQPNDCDSTRRKFLSKTAAGVMGVSTASMTRSPQAAEPTGDTVSVMPPGDFRVISDTSICKGSTVDLGLQFSPRVPLKAGSALWLFFDIRQAAGMPQIENPNAANYLSVTIDGRMAAANAVQVPSVGNWGIRTFDLLPRAPEFLFVVEVTADQRVAVRQMLDIVISQWTGPQQPIDPFSFWLVVDHRAEWELIPAGYRSYRSFVTREGQERVPTKDLFEQTVTASLSVTGSYEAVPAVSHRTTPGVFWGEFHGMVFNQRPLDDYYNYARRITKLDFCTPMWFSYNTCINDVWSEVKAAAQRHNEPGRFVALAGFECGTPPDGSHRCIVFRDPVGIPPIFCDERPPARDSFFQQRFHPDTIQCATVDELCEVVAKFGGIVTGHFHTLRYHSEVLCEMYQKNLTSPEDEEQRLYELMRAGRRFALAGTSDTHDSMPGNPRPEPHLPVAAGFTGVHAEELTAEALFDAVLARRVYATSGARIYMNLQSNGRPMGAALPVDATRTFQIEIDGTEILKSVELLRDGRPIETWWPERKVFSASAEDAECSPEQTAFYHVRVTQTDQHKGWTSPIWFG